MDYEYERGEPIIVSCEHCGGDVDLAFEDHCPKCHLSIFMSPKEAFECLMTPYDPKLAEAITKAGQKYIRELIALMDANGIKIHTGWTDKPEPKSSLEIEIERSKNKLEWGVIFERYTHDVPDWETNKLMPLEEWLIRNYKVPDEK